MPRFPFAADLHAHCTASDGELEPEALVDAFAETGLGIMALTDHDTTAGLARAQARGREKGIEVIAGCELTAYAGAIEMHILAWFFDPAADAPLALLLRTVRERRRERALKMGAKLREHGIAVADEDILEAAAGCDSIGKPHVAAAIVKRGHASNIQHAMTRYLSGKMPANVAKMPLTPAEVFAAVHASGGLACLAHPALLKHDELIAGLFRQGMDAVEANHQSHSEVNRRFYAGLARRYEKGVGGGSDFHGPRTKPDVRLGASGVTKEQLADLRRRARDRNSALSPAAHHYPQVRMQ